MLGQLIRLCAVTAIGIGAVLFIQTARAADTVDSLAADPERLREVQKLCKEDWVAAGEELCTAASKARRKRFMGSGQTPYTPRAIELFPSLKEDGTPKDSTPSVAPGERQPAKQEAD